MSRSVDRRKFLSMFAAGSVGMTVADKIGFLGELKDWVLSPSKTIFVPPPSKIQVWEMFTEFAYARNYILSPGETKFYLISEKYEEDKAA